MLEDIFTNACAIQISLGASELEQAGTGPSRRHIQGSKIAKGLQESIYSNPKSIKQKNGPIGAPGLALARAPGALKGGHFRNCQHFCRSWRGYPLEKKQIFGKKSHSAEKNWKGGPFGLAQYGMLRGKTGKTFLVQFARPNSAIWCNNIL